MRNCLLWMSRSSGLDPLIRSELLKFYLMSFRMKIRQFSSPLHITSDLDKIADFVTLIHNGEIILSMAKDDILDNYRIVKGGKEVLNSDIRKIFVGIKENQFGFEALIKDKNQAKRKLGDRVHIEKPTLRILCCITQGGLRMLNLHLIMKDVLIQKNKLLLAFSTYFCYFCFPKQRGRNIHCWNYSIYLFNYNIFLC